MLLKILIAIAAIWLALALIGFLFKVFFWVVIIGILVAVVGAGFGWFKRENSDGL